MDLITTNQNETSSDIELELEYEIEEDIEAELENFVRLNHTGQFEDAHELFDECLSSHDHWYPIAAEYADCLLREGKFKQLAEFSRKASMTFRDPGEKVLLRLMVVIGNLTPKHVMRQQLQALWPIGELKPPYTSLRDTDIHILELVLLALVLTRMEPKDLEASLTSDGIFEDPWSVFKDWFYHLLRNELFWEAQRILHSLLHVSRWNQCQTMVHDYIEKAVSTTIGEESVQIAVSSLVQRFIYVAESRWSSPLAVVPWNDAITWALFGVTLAKTSKNTTSPFKCITLRRSLQEKLAPHVGINQERFAPNIGINLPLDSKRGNDEMSDSLYEAVKNGDVSMMRQAMTVSRYGWDEVKSTALPLVAQHCSEKEVQVFLDSDTAHARDGYQRTALHWAAIKGDRPTIDTLLLGGADPGSLDWFGRTPLQYAIKSWSFAQHEAVDSILSFGSARVNKKDLSGLGPLHIAILHNARDIVKQLFRNGAVLETDEINPLPPFDSGNVDWDYKARAYSTSGLTSLQLRRFQPRDLTLTGAKHGAWSKRPRSSISDGADLSRSHSREKSSSDQLGLRTSRSHLLAGLRTAPKSPKPSPSTTPPGQHTRQIYPPTNTPDQNPPCNTLYVGNLPADTSEDELKDLFSKQKGYKRLCFRTQQNGPMCFVEFEDVSFATKALEELDDHSLHNSTNGGIRLSFSKDPLGIRAVGIEAVEPSESSTRPFDSAKKPPPGLFDPAHSLSRFSQSLPRTEPWNPLRARHRAVKLPLRTPSTASEMRQSSPSGPT